MTENRTVRYVSLSILMLAAVLRLVVYFQDRSFIIDEANLAKNIVEKDYGDFLQSLDYAQYAPPLFSSITKLSTQIFGNYELAFKILPILGSLLSLFFLWKLSQLLIPKAVPRWHILCLFGFSSLAVTYASEFKQYSTDAAVTLAFIYYALLQLKNKWTWKSTLIWSLAGMTVVWFSMPIVFSLATIGFVFLFHYQGFKHIKILGQLALMGILWLSSFAIYFMLILYEDSQSDYLQDFHASFFMDLLPKNQKELVHSLHRTRVLFSTVTDHTIVSTAMGLLAALTGLFALKKQQNWSIVCLIFGPIFFCMIASHLHLYSLIERMTLFMIPLILLLVGAGYSYLWQFDKKWLQAPLIVVFAISIINQDGFSFFANKLEKEDNKGLLNYLQKEHQAPEFIYVHHDAKPAFHFYNEHYAHAYGFSNYYLANWGEKPSEIIPQHIDKTATFWIYFSHTFPEDITRDLNDIGIVAEDIQHYQTIEASAYQFKFK